MKEHIKAFIKTWNSISKRLAASTLSGNYLSTFKGSGLNFHQLREYQPGDDVRLIQWSSSLKVDKLMVKQFIEEKDRTIFFLIDLSASMRFSSHENLKSDTLTSVATLLSMLAMHYGDRIGALFFTDIVEHFIPPARGMKTCSRIIESLMTLKPRSKKSSIAAALHFVHNLKRRNLLIFCFSDWIEPTENYNHALKVAARIHEIIAFRFLDTTEYHFPSSRYLQLYDPENGSTVTMYGTSNLKALTQAVDMRAQEQKKLFLSLHIDLLTLEPNKPFIKPLSSFFHQRTLQQL
jgi:uncharacterized protein (DUF58 family)